MRFNQVNEPLFFLRSNLFQLLRANLAFHPTYNGFRKAKLCRNFVYALSGK